MIFSVKSVKSKIFLLYGTILILVVIFFNVIFYYFTQDYFYKNTIQALKSISLDVFADDIQGKDLTKGIALAIHKYEFSIRNVYIQALYKDKIVLKSKNLKDYELPGYAFKGDNNIVHLNLNHISKYDLIMYSTTVSEDRDYTIQIATTIQDEKQHLRKIINMFMIGDPVFIIIMLFVIYKMLQDILKPMNTMTKAAREISITDLDKRIEYVDNGDEFAQLAKTFNKMLSRLQSSFNQVKRFSSDASHQLKTPLTAMRVQTDVALKTDRNTDDYKDVLKSINNEIIYLQNMIDNLLLLTQMDDEIVQKNFTKIELDTVLINTIEEFVLIADKKSINLDIKEIEHTMIKAQSTLISILCSNLIDNAIKYTPKGKKVTVELKDNKIIIQDEGIGIEKKDKDAIFDRFFRVNSGRLDIAGGYGLGLSMVKIIANLHNADISIKSKIGFGTKIEVTFPSL
ncbi:MAG: ATP-binding protein [Sulfurospirillum sp.]